MDAKRLKVLKAFRRRAPHHRYNGWRIVGLTVSMGILLVPPLTGLVRIDLWRGDHRLLFQPAAFNVTLAVVLAIFALIYGVTFLINLVAGRMLCGWGCPIGHLHRLTENNQTPGLSARRALFYRVLAPIYAFLLPLSVMVWWVDWRALFEGPTNLRVGLASGLVVGTLAALAHGRWWSWNFCKQVCPIGLYYSFVAPARWFGITFRRPENCIECNLCDNVCPVHLEPRTLSKSIPYRGGLSIADAPGRNHCLECGDCVRACEWIVRKQTGKEAPLTLGFHKMESHGKGWNEFGAEPEGA